LQNSIDGIPWPVRLDNRSEFISQQGLAAQQEQMAMRIGNAGLVRI
jgi:hypothetical protein